ncbi:MAG TPA: PAS domain-containing protein [Ramlibacter sp.]|uniref:PAS domain-containing protein n=1 Tax=Ramlibacter sp. TaxID=1917967 RepID=UPI002D802485|nr:PAS domain-containing protein [Ramlibacter sp.]HET8744511.1 PAS domain-containing protein [Ramlibacter sp.]
MTSIRPAPAFLQGGGAMGERIRNFDWGSHPLGPPEDWPPALRMAMSLCLNSSFPTAIYWGPQFHLLYNDTWSEIPAEKHPAVLGLPAREAWSDIWDIVGPQFRHVFETGEGMALYEQMLPMVRGGRRTETWWNYSLTAIRDAEHGIAGIFNQGNDITAVVHARRARQAEIERWRELFRQAPAAVALLRGPNHVFEFANEAYLRLVAQRDVTGKPVAEAVPEVRAQGFLELLDGVYRSGEPYLGTGVKVKLQRRPDGPEEDCVLDFVYQPVHNAAGEVDAVLVLASDVTDRARAEAALRLSNWQLGEERARLAALIEAEQRARLGLRRLNETLEAHVNSRTAELTRALAAQNAVADRLRATFETDLIFQGFLDTHGTLLDANPASLAAIHRTREQVVGRPFWETEWFSATPGMGERMRAAVEAAARGETVRTHLRVNLPDGPRSFLFSVRPVVNARREIVGLVPEALEMEDPAAKAAAPATGLAGSQ